MDKAFTPADIEARIYTKWEADGCFAPSGSGPAYSIVIPPPNVTGTLHMGHAFQDTIMDALTRHRMRGFDTLWQPGTDHAGIATQMGGRAPVERRRPPAGWTSGARRSSNACGNGRRNPAGLIANQMRRLGASVDWTRDRFTMDPELSRAVSPKCSSGCTAKD